MKNLSVIILAAGKGTRMQSDKAKVLHPVGGKPMLHHVIETAQLLQPHDITVVIGHDAETVKACCASFNVNWAYQTEQLGTGHAVQTAIDQCLGDQVLVLYGDVPLITQATLEKLLTVAQLNPLALLTVKLNNPTGYGRIVRESSGAITQIIEEKDANQDTKLIKEVNTGILCADKPSLVAWLSKLDNDNAQQEYYLTDCTRLCHEELGSGSVNGISADNFNEVSGVNNKVQLNEQERCLQQRLAEELMHAGVTLADSQRIDIRGNVTVGKDVYIDINAVLIGDIHLDDGVSIGPNCTITNSRIGKSTSIFANTVIEEAQVGMHCNIGPFARLRPGTVLAEAVKIGNYVETKKSQIGIGSKVNHLSYIGDAKIGENVNVGAGTITCNYDGVNKAITEINDDAFIGSNTALVAPVTIGTGATIGAGSVITKNAPDGKLSLTRNKQLVVDLWQRPTKKK